MRGDTPLKRVSYLVLLAAMLAVVAGRCRAEPVVYAETETGYILLTQRQEAVCGKEFVAYATASDKTDKGCWHYDGKEIIVSWFHGPKNIKYDSGLFMFVPDLGA